MLRRLIAGAIVALVSFGPALADGPRCTPQFPYGFKFKPSELMKPTCSMDVDGIVWGSCIRRVEI